MTEQRRRLIRPRLASLLLVLLWAPVATSSSAFTSQRLLTAEGNSIHYLQGGGTTASPGVVFIPGWNWTADVWQGQMQFLAPTRAVIAMDPRSQGESSIAAEGNTPEGRASDIEALLASLGSRPVVLVGWSQGVQDIAAYVERYGTARLAGIVFVDSPPAAGPASFELDPQGTVQFLQRIGIYARYPSEYLAGMMDASLTHPLSAAEKARRVEAGRRTPTGTGIGMLVTDVLTTDRRGVVAKIRVPTLVIAASSSGELDAQRKLAQDIPGARFVVVDKARHAVFLDQPGKFSSALAAFLAGLDAQAAEPKRLQ